MKTTLKTYLSLALLILLSFTACQTLKIDAKKGKPAHNLSYSFGANLAKAMSSMGLNDYEKNTEEFVKGFAKGLEGDSATMKEAITLLQQRMKTQARAKTEEEGAKIAYAFGLGSIGNLATEVEVPAKDFDLNALKLGFSTRLKGDKLALKKEEMDSILKTYFDPKAEKYRKITEAKKTAATAKTIEEGKKFLEANGKREGVMTTESGLQYEVIKEGTGERPTIADKVKTHYHGTLIDGTVFDSSVDRGEPITFPLNAVIKGWQKGIPLMTVGSKYKLFIPQELAYGMNSPSPSIPAGSMLIFEVELLEINPVD